MSGPPADRDELDRRIREAFSNAGSPVAPDTLRASLERLPAAALGRQPTRRPLGLSGAIIIAVALVLVGAVVANRLQAPAATPPPTAAPMASPSASAEVASSGPPASAVALVPWSAATPPPQPRLPTPRPVPPGTRACTAADLAATADWQGATGSMAGGIVATNVGSTACVLDGPPSDVVVHAGPTTMPTTYAGDRGHGPDGAIPSGPALLEPGERGVWWLSWTNWCGSDLVASSVTVTLPDGSGPLVAGPDPSSPNPGLGTPRCDAPDDPSSLTVFSFVAQPPEGPIPRARRRRR